MSVQISNRFRCIVIVDFFSIHPEKQAVKKIIDGKLLTENYRRKPSYPSRSKSGKEGGIIKTYTFPS